MLTLHTAEPVRLDPFPPVRLAPAVHARDEAEFRQRVLASPRIAHARLLHSDLPGVKGKVSLMRASEQADGEYRWETQVVSISELLDSDALLWATHIGMQRFYGARGSTALAQVQALIADLDCHDCAEFRGKSPEEMAGIVIERIRAAGLPLPSYVLFSGRGLHVVWLHEPRIAEPGFMHRWRAVQRWLHGPKGGKAMRVVRTSSGTRLQDPEVIAHEERMAGVWCGTGLDRGASDTARVLRLAGTYNPKSRTIARLVWPASWTDVQRHTFEDLAAAFMPFKRHEMAALKAERQAEWQIREDARQARRAEAEAAGLPLPEDKPRRRENGNRWATVVEALDAIRVWWGGTPPEGRRDWWAFLSACAIAMDQGGDAATWAARLAPLAGLPEAELRTSLGGLERMLRRYEAGETSERNGVERPAMYAYSSARMLALLGLSEDDAAAAGADVLLPSHARPRRSERERSAERRAAQGMTPQELTVAARLADGREALALRAQGMSMVGIIAVFAGRRGKTSLTRAMAEAEAASGTVAVAEQVAVENVAAPSEDQSTDTVHGLTTSIVALPVAPATQGPAVACATPETPFATRPIVVPDPIRPIPVQAGSVAGIVGGWGVGSGSVVGGVSVASPGRHGTSVSPASPLPTEEQLPAFLRYLLGVDTASVALVPA